MAVTIDDFLCSLGKPGRYQIISWLLLWSNVYPIAFNNIVMVFYGIIPKHQCKLPYDSNATSSVSFNNTLQSCSILADPLNETGGTTPCINGWDYDPEHKQRSIVSEWDLVCDKKWQLSVGISVYFVGVMIGGLFGGFLADKIGRQPVVLVGIYAQAILGLSIVFVQSYVAFVTLRFFHAIILQSVQGSSFTLMMEMLQPKMRDKAGVLGSFGWLSGMAVTALLAWLLDDWRHVQLALTLPSIFSFFYFWFISESMRWLITHQKVDRAEALARKIASFNKIELSSDMRAQIEQLSLDCIRKDQSRTSKKYNVIDLVRTPQIRKYTLVVAFAYFTSSVITYGTAFGLSSIANNIYLSIVMNNGLELPLCGVTFLLLRKVGRRLPVAITLGLAGTFCLIASIILFAFGETATSRTAATVVVIIGKTFMSFTWAILTVFLMELNPTVIRGLAIGFAIFCTRVGGIVAPQVAFLGVVVWKPAPFLICGVLGIIAALLILLLPDTHRKALPNMIDDVENKTKTKVQDDVKETIETSLIHPHNNRSNGDFNDKINT